MIMIDVLNMMANGEIRKGTKLIIDLSNEQDSPETYTYDGKRFMDESRYEWYENFGSNIKALRTEVKLIEPPLYYLKMPNSERVLGVLGKYRKLVFEPMVTFQKYTSAVYLFTQDEIESLDILAPYRNFEWSEYNESVDN